MKLTTERIKKKLLSKIKKTNKGCWEWTGALSGTGYGSQHDGEQMQKAHRLSYEVFVGNIPSKKIVMHSCDNTSCINPKHLKVGTFQENMQEASFRNRFPRVSFFRDPITHSHAKLNWEQVDKIRNLYAEGIYTYAELGRMFKVKAINIKAIVLKYIWRWKTKQEWLRQNRSTG